jgi:Leucine-rich repeat (LRR) protein
MQKKNIFPQNAFLNIKTDNIIGFQEKCHFFAKNWRKSPKIGENRRKLANIYSDQNIDLWSPCFFRQLPPRSFVGLTRLKSLALHTFNADWTSMALEPDYESLVGLNSLEALDLSHNNLASMPAGLLCPLMKIVTVSLLKICKILLELVLHG